jgi:hypothetical protein
VRSSQETVRLRAVLAGKAADFASAGRPLWGRRCRRDHRVRGSGWSGGRMNLLPADRSPRQVDKPRSRDGGLPTPGYRRSTKTTGPSSVPTVNDAFVASTPQLAFMV